MNACITCAHARMHQVTIGQARLLHKTTGKMPALVIRTDVANIYGSQAPPLPFCDLQHPDIVLQALQMDACGVICNLFKLPDDAEGAVDVHRKCVQNVTHLRSECSKYGVVLLVEPLAFKWATDGNGKRLPKFTMDNSLAVTRPLVRLACELGADVIKCDLPDQLQEFSKLKHVCAPRPVLLRGGEKGEEASVLQYAKGLIGAGASGLVYGRNIIHHDDPCRITREFMKCVHGGV